MEFLKPLTISKSIGDSPTVLLTDNYLRYKLICPTNDYLLIAHRLKMQILSHFGVPFLKSGLFSLSSKQYFCVEEPSNKLIFDPLNVHLWNSKRKFNNFINPKVLFQLYLIDLFFPIFNKPSKKILLLDRKYFFSTDASIDVLSEKLIFKNHSLQQVGLEEPHVILFFSFFDKQIDQVFNDFLELHHEKLYLNLKYQMSLYQTHRNEYWSELVKCFDKDFIKLNIAQIKDYLIRLKS